MTKFKPILIPLIIFCLIESHGQSMNTKKVYCNTKSLIAQENFDAGNVFLSKGQLDKASEYFSLATIEDSLFCEAWDNLAVVMRRKSDYNKALTYYLKSYNINNRNDVACINSAEILLLRNKLELAYKWFAKAIEIDSTNPEGYFGQSKCLLGIQEFDKALITLNKAKILYQQKNGFVDHDVQFLEGVIYFSKGEISNAKSIFEHEYNYYSENPNMNYYLGYCYLESAFQNNELAKKYLLKAQNGGMTIDKKTWDKLEK